LLIIGHKGWLYDGELKPLAYTDIKAQLRGEAGSDAGRVVAQLRGEPGSGAGRVISLDYVSFRLLIPLIRSARAVLFPSIYEGFGLPILEAMTCGTPVMTSNYGAMKEIAGAEAGLLVDPLNVGEMAAAIGRLTSDDDLCMRLSAAGLGRSKEFSMDKYQTRLTAAYGAAFGNGQRTSNPLH
jgi:glycosyltransferase involved in cell wall biosynthesis